MARRLRALLSHLGPEVSALARADEIKRPLLAPRTRRATTERLPQLFEDDAATAAALPPAETSQAIRQVFSKGRNFH